MTIPDKIWGELDRISIELNCKLILNYSDNYGQELVNRPFSHTDYFNDYIFFERQEFLFSLLKRHTFVLRLMIFLCFFKIRG